MFGLVGMGGVILVKVGVVEEGGFSLFWTTTLTYLVIEFVTLTLNNKAYTRFTPVLNWWIIILN